MLLTAMMSDIARQEKISERPLCSLRQHPVMPLTG